MKSGVEATARSRCSMPNQGEYQDVVMENKGVKPPFSLGMEGLGWSIELDDEFYLDVEEMT